MALDKNKINSVFPEAVMYEPMLIHKSTDSQLKQADESGEWFGQLKKDGALYIYEHHKIHSYLFGRTVSKKNNLLTEKSENVPHIMRALEMLPPHTILLGEIYYPGGTSKNVTSIMGCLPEKAIERQNGSYGKIHYYIHDILAFDGVDLVKEKVDNYTRYKILKRIFKLYKLDKYDFLELAAAWENNLYERVGDALSRGEEGMVFKKKNGIYEPGKRPQTNIKAKKVDFIDAIVIGFEPPTREYYGKDLTNWEYWYCAELGEMVKGLYAGQADNGFTPVTKAYYMGWENSRIRIGAIDNGSIKDIGVIHSGISDEMKRDMSENPDKYLNKVCAIQCMEKDNKEKTLRHGFFKYMRDDKAVEDCLIETIFC